MNEEATFLRETQAAEYLTLKVATLQHWRVVGKGPAFLRFGASIRYTREALDDYVAGCLHDPQQERTP